MKTFLILAGRSRRFWPLSEKSLFPLCGKTLLEHQVERLRKAGCTDITLVVGAHNKEEIKGRFPDLPQIEQRDLDLGMQGAFLDALHGVEESVLLVSGNDVIDASAFRTLLDAAKKKGVDGALLAKKVDRYFPGGYLTLDGNRIAGIVEKPGEGNEPSDLVNIVAHVHNHPQQLLAALREITSDRDDGYERALDQLFSTHHYAHIAYDGPWQAVKFPWHLLHLLPLLLSEITEQRIAKTASIHPTAAVQGNVIIDDGARVLPYASIVGPCYIGKNTIVGNNALVRGSSIGDGCVIGYNTEVKGSVLAGPVWTHMTYLGDSVVGGNVSFGGGCITGNLRLDEGEIGSAHGDAILQSSLTKFGVIVGNDCRFGIHVGTNPGIKIGPGTFVAGGCFLSQDIPDRSFVSIKEGVLRVVDNRTTVPGMDARDRYKKTV